MIDVAESNRRLTLTLEKMIEVAEKYPQRFDFNRWVGRDWLGMTDLSCGTTACIAGWAATVPELQKLGLHLVRDGGSGIIMYKSSADGGHEISHSRTALEEFYGLTSEEVEWVFYPQSLQDKKMTAAEAVERLRAFIETREIGDLDSGY